MQLFSVPPYTPPAIAGEPIIRQQEIGPPSEKVELPDTKQLEATAFVDSHDSPPPEWARPWVKVKPAKLAPLVKYAQRMAPPPSMMVDCGPLTLRNVSGLSTATRF